MAVSVLGRSVGVPQAVLALLVLALVAGVVTVGATSTAPYDSYNADWTGTSDLRRLADADGRTLAFAPAAGGPETTHLVVGTPANASADRVARSVRAGGTLVVADESPAANAYLAGVGADARVRPGPVRDPRHFERSPLLPAATTTGEAPLDDGATLRLNRAGVVDPNGATVLARTSAFAYVDRNENGALDDDESLGVRPVATVERVGQGRVVVVSDSSPFVNAMLDRADNRAVVTALLGDDRVVLATGRTALPALAAALLALRDAPLLGAGALALALVGLLGLSRAVARESGDADAVRVSAERRATGLADALARDRPAVDRQRLTRVARAWVTMRDREGTRRDE